MAATSHPLATLSALQVLRDGGNAVDAAIAASATLCVVEPHMTGIGGDCFVILADPDGQIHGLNGSGRAPARADAAFLRGLGHVVMPEFGVHSVTVPGSIDAWERLLERFGTLGFDRLFADAIHYAEEGFAVAPRVARDWARQLPDLRKDPGAQRHWLVNGAAPVVGQRFRAPALGRTLRTIASKGAKGFYEGAIAAEIAATVQAGGGVLSEEDLAGVQADWVAPLGVDYRGTELLEIPPNGQGITALILMRLMQRARLCEFDPDSVERYHAEIELGRLAYSVRDHLVSDPATMTLTPAELLSERFIDGLFSQFSRERRNPAVALPDMPKADTVYLTIVDRDRRAISFINSVYDAFGSRVVTTESAIALQNRGACFSLEEGHANEYGSAKRPMHTIIPAMALRGCKVFASFGVMGGDYQPMGHAHVLSNIVDHGMDPQAAIDHPRLFWEEGGSTLLAEAGIGARLRAGLEAMGHTVADAPSPLGGGQMIVIDEESGFLIGGSDARKDGCALGW